VRKEKIRQNIDRLRWHENEELKEFGISIHPQLMKLDARQLPPPTPQFATGTDHDPPAAGRWNLRGKTFVKPRQLGSWGIVYFSAPGRGRIGNEPEDAVINRLEQELTRTLRNHSIRVQGRGLIMKADLMGDYEKTLREFHNKCKAQTNQRPDLVVLGLVDGSTHTYNELKRVCETEAGMASQVILLPKFASQKNPAQYLSNVSLKINLKLGGVNHILEDEFFRKQNVMLIGADTSHPAGDSMAPTISALAGTYDQKCSRYTAVTSAQIGGQEIISNFSAMGKELINRYVDVNKCQPDSILYFRDGVTDAQYISVLTTELAELKGALFWLDMFFILGGERVANTITEHTTAKVTVIVCTKRHHTRFFPVQGQGDKLGNALPGTLVENHGGKDIFLVAHPGLQGTVRPTHYITVYDANNLDANTFQRIVYNLCYSYARATTAVSLVPPVYYADLACFRARSHMNPDDPNKLNEVRSSLKWTMVSVIALIIVFLNLLTFY
jgi:eukaryotic translation initiation factor 2C